MNKFNRKVNLKNKTINYSFVGKLRAEEINLLEKSIGEAYALAAESLKKVKMGDENALGYIEKIYSDVSAKTLSRISKAFEGIIQKLESEIEIRRRPAFISEDGERAESVLAGAKPNIGNVIQIYDAFFKEAEGDDKNLNQRGSVILHELAHLIGLNSDAEIKSVNSAEALRNLCLLVCGIANEEDFLEIMHSDSDGGEKSPSSGLSDEELEGADGEKPYDPDQPRDDLGKWTAGGVSSTDAGSKKSDKDDKKSEATRTPYEHAHPKMSKAMKERIDAGRYFTFEEAKEFVGDILDTMEKDVGNGSGIINSEDIKALLLGTAITESELVPRDQEGGGPAKGLMQIEEKTFDDLWNGYLESDKKFPGSDKTRREVKEWIKHVATPADGEISHGNLNENDELSAIMARIKYISKQDAAPKANDIKGQAKYYAKHYYAGDKQVDRAGKYVNKYQKFSKVEQKNE